MAYVVSLLQPTDLKEILRAFVAANQMPSQHLIKSLADVCGITEETLRRDLTDCQDAPLRGDDDLFNPAAGAEFEPTETATTTS